MKATQLLMSKTRYLCWQYTSNIFTQIYNGTALCSLGVETET